MVSQKPPKVNREEVLGAYLLSLSEKTKEDSRQIAEVIKVLAKFAKDSWDKVEAFLERVEEKIDKRLTEVKDGKDGERGEKGEKGDRGERGERGEKGETFIALRGERGEKGKDGSPDTGDQIIDKINTQSKKLIVKEAIEGIGELQKELEKVKEIRITGTRSFFGAKGIGLYIGGAKKLLTAQQINLVAGTNVSIAYNYANGRNDITISATGGSGSLSILTATGTINDTNTAFTFASEPTLVIVNGASYRHGAGVTISGVNVTLDNPVGQNGDIYGLG